MDFPIKAIDMLKKREAWQTNVIATLWSVKYDTHHAWTSVSYHIITTDWPSPERQGVCKCVCVCVCVREADAETITQSERNSTDHAGVHSHSVCLSSEGRPLSEEQQTAPCWVCLD